MREWRSAVILNAYSLLALFAGVVQLALGTFVAGLSVSALRRHEGGGDAASETRLPLLFLASGVLLGVSVASWPLLYLLLDSYVPQWKDVMCIQGVVRVGTGSEGAAGRLPTLVTALQATKPLLVFATGTWLLLHSVNRRTRTAPLTPRVLRALAATGALAVVDAAAQVAYVAIPKKEEFLSRGCCTAAADAVGPFADGGGPSRAGLAAASFVAIACVAGLTWWARRRSTGDPARGRTGTLPLFLAALAVLPVGIVFLREVAAPAFLGLPGHRCAYCLVSSAPLGLLAIGLFLLGAFSTAWGCILRWCADLQETRDFLPGNIATLLGWGLFGWLSTAILTAVQLGIA